MSRKLFWKSVAAVAAGLSLLLIAVPVAYLLLSSSPSRLWQTLVEPEVARSLVLTGLSALTATLLGVLLGTPLAYLLARFEFVGRELLQGIIDLPIVIPHPVAGIALLLLFSGFHPSLSPVGHWTGVVIAMFFVSSSLLINTVQEGFQAVPRTMEWTARSLGLSPAATFFRVSLPLVRPSLLAGGIMMWARSVSEFGAIVILVYHPRVASVLIYDRFSSYGLKSALPVAGILLWASVILFVILRLVQRKRGSHAGH